MHSQRMAFSEGSFSQGLRPAGKPCSYAFICIPTLFTFIQRPLYLGPFGQGFPQRPLWRPSNRGKERENEDSSFVHSDSAPSTFPLPAIYSLPPGPCFHKTVGAFCLMLPRQGYLHDWTDPIVPHLGGNGTRGTDAFSGLTSCLHYHSKSLKG